MITDIENVFRLNDEHEIFEFCKEYAFKNQAFAKELTDRFLPKKNDTTKSKFGDIDKEFAKCFKYTKQKVRYNEWESTLDWHSISEDLCRLIDKGRYMLNNGLVPEVTYLALELLSKMGEEYDEYAMYDHSFDYDDFSTSEAVLLLEEVVKLSTVTKQEKLRIANELEQISEFETYKLHSLCDFDRLIESIKKSQLSADDYIEYLKSEMNNDSDYSKNESAIKLFHFLLECNQRSEAESWAKEHLEYSRLLNTYVDWLIGEQRLNDALSTLDIGIRNNAEHKINQSSLLEKKLEIYESQHDTANIIELCHTLFLTQYKYITYYYKLKKHINTTAWDNYFDELITHKKFDGNACNTLTQIYYEEKRYIELFEMLNKSDKNLLSALQKYAIVLTEEQQSILIVKIEKTLISFAENQMGRKNYQELTHQLETLKASCKIGEIHCKKLVELFRANYRNRPAMIDELKSL